MSRSKELEAVGVDLVATDQSLDTTTPAGRLLFTLLGTIVEFERDIILERVVAGIRRAKAQGIRVGRPGARFILPSSDGR